MRRVGNSLLDAPGTRTHKAAVGPARIKRVQVEIVARGEVVICEGYTDVMAFARAELPGLRERLVRLEEELADPRHFPAPVGRLAAERRGAEMAKRQFLFAAKWAATLGPALEQRQEVLAALATPEGRANPYPLYQRLRAIGPTATAPAWRRSHRSPPFRMSLPPPGGKPTTIRTTFPR